MIIYFTLLFLFVLIYAFILLWHTYFWNKIKVYEPNGKMVNNFISVLIPVRNEENGIVDLLRSIENQSYSKSFFEVIVIDDFSNDNTFQLVQDFKSSYTLKLIRATKEGKKNALTQGVIEANGTIIVHTDGDCVVQSKWLENFNIMFSDIKVDFISGPVAFTNDISFFKQVQNYEFLGLIGLGASAIQFGKPNMCNGANLAYRKLKFLEVNGYQGNEYIASGDDEFLLSKISKGKKTDNVKFAKINSSVVYTKPQETLTDFLNQRIRWSSKWAQHKISLTSFFPIFIFIFYSMLLGSLFFLDKEFFLVLFLIIIGLKIGVEVMFMLPILIFFHKKKLILHIFVIQFLYPFYTIIIAVLSFKSSYQWKNRKVS